MVSTRWLALVSSWLAWFWSHGTRVGVSAITPFIRERMSLSIAEASALPGLLNLGFYTSNIMSGQIARTLGYGRAVAVGAIGASALFAISSQLGEKILFYAVMAAVGLFLALHLPSAIPWVSSLFDARRRGFFIGVHESAAPAGQTLGPIILTLLIVSVGLAAAMPLWAIASVAAGSAALLVGNGQILKNGGRIGRVAGSGLSRLTILSFVVLTTGMLVGNLGVVAIVPLYLVESVGLDKSLVAALVGLSRILGVLGQPLGGILYDRLGFFKVVSVITAANILSSAYIAYGPYNLIYVAMMVAQATSTAMYFPIFYSHIVHLSGERAGIAIGRIISVSGLIGPTSAPLVAGYLAETYNHQVALTYPLVMILLAIPVLSVSRGLGLSQPE
ncbi:MAG: MFS transporter [Nitrososphaerota archaeon]